MRLLAPLIALIALCSPALATSDCLRVADHQIINGHFSDGGPGTKVYLCPGVEYTLRGTVVFTAADQELATLGYPSGDKRAILRIDSERIATAVQGDCRRCARVAVRNLIINGSRRTFGRVRDPNNSPGLIVLGGAVGQTVRECHISDPRGFTAIHVREGPRLNCRGAVIEQNEITSVGEEYDKEYDGADPESSPWGRPLADGISIACRDSFVRDNVLTDCTDAGIVVYCSPGTKIENNRVTTENRGAIGGILLVDSSPFKGDYSGVMVRDNILDASGRSMRVGIGLGLSILSDDIETILKGGSVISNRLTGSYMGYGIAAAGLSGWTIEDNWDDARYEGEPSERCFDEPVNPPPQAFIYNSATLEKSKVQDGFFDSDFAYIVCIDGVGETPVRYSALTPKGLAGPKGRGAKKGHSEDAPALDHKAPEQVPVAPLVESPATGGDEDGEAAPELLPGGLLSTGSDMLDGILMHSHQRLLARIDEITHGVKSSIKRSNVPADAPRFPIDDIAATDPNLHKRLTELEQSQSSLLSAARAAQSAVAKLKTKVDEVGTWEGDVLRKIQQEVESPSAGSPEDEDDEPAYDGFEFEYADDGMVGLAMRLVMLGGLCSAVALGVRRYRRKREHGKMV